MLQCVALYCSVLQCVAVSERELGQLKRLLQVSCCVMLQCVVVCCVAVCCSLLQYAAVSTSISKRELDELKVAASGFILQSVAL